MTGSIFTQWAPQYIEQGFWPRPVTPGTKACKVKNWTNPDPEWAKTFLESNGNSHDYGIGLLMGSLLPDGSKLAALDIDNNDYIGLGEALLGPTVCGRIGEKGCVIFVRVASGSTAKSCPFNVDGTGKQVGDFLFTGKLCVLPPTIHPDINEPYHWVGSPLLDVDLTQLPIIGA